jgi:3-methyladenine DNA glycosylase/8-oxoguanine DNA glycosylase
LPSAGTRRSAGWSATIALKGAGGEPVDLRRTVDGHGLTALLPMTPDPDQRGFGIVLRMPRGRPLAVRVREGGRTRVRVTAPATSAARRQAALDGVRHVLRLDEDLSGFYEQVLADDDLSWACTGAGRMMRSQTVFEDVVKTICTTNCAWSGTVRMVTGLVDGLGEAAVGGGHAFPTPEAMAQASDAFYADDVRAGYRGAYLRALADDVASGKLDLEALAAAPRDELPDEELEERLLALAGVGPYAAAHIMMLMGRHSRLILDSWTRPTYAKLRGRKQTDKQILRRFKRYGDHAGLAFWLTLTRSWVTD